MQKFVTALIDFLLNITRWALKNATFDIRFSGYSHLANTHLQITQLPGRQKVLCHWPLECETFLLDWFTDMVDNCIVNTCTLYSFTIPLSTNWFLYLFIWKNVTINCDKLQQALQMNDFPLGQSVLWLHIVPFTQFICKGSCELHLYIIYFNNITDTLLRFFLQ